MVSPALVPSRPGTARNPLGRYKPTNSSAKTRWRFVRERRTEYLRRVGGVADDRERLLITQMIEAEWSALLSEAEARQLEGKLRLASLRIAAEHRRQLLLLDRDLVVAIRERERREERAAGHQVAPASLAEHLGRV